MSEHIGDADLTRYMAFAHRLAEASGQAIRPHFRNLDAVANKLSAGFDPVTVADQAGERAIRELIRAEHPTHAILGEEEGHTLGASALTWVIDPIDGTRAFMVGQPLWGTLIALNDGARPILGVLDQPVLKERFWGDGRSSAVSEAGTTRSLKTRRVGALDQAILSATHPELFDEGPEAAAFQALSRRTRMTRFGGDCYAYGLLAMGLIDLVVEAKLKPYDIQALIPIVQGAGGVVTDWRGGDAAQGGQVVACGDPGLLRQVLDILAPGAQG